MNVTLWSGAGAGNSWSWAAKNGPLTTPTSVQRGDEQAGKQTRKREAPGQPPVAHTLADHAPVC